MIEKLVKMVELIFVEASKSSSFFKRRKKKQKSRRDTIDCVPDPATLLRSGMGIVSVSRDNRNAFKVESG